MNGSIFENHHDGPRVETPTQEDDGKVLTLIGALVQRNVDDLAWTNDQIQKALDSDIRQIGGVLADLIAIIDDALVIDRRTEARLRAMDGRISIALDIYRRKQEEV